MAEKNGEKADEGFTYVVCPKLLSGLRAEIMQKDRCQLYMDKHNYKAHMALAKKRGRMKEAIVDASACAGGCGGETTEDRRGRACVRCPYIEDYRSMYGSDTIALRDSEGNVTKFNAFKDARKLAYVHMTPEQEEARRKRNAEERALKEQLAAQNMIALGDGKALAEVKDLMERNRREASEEDE